MKIGRPKFEQCEKGCVFVARVAFTYNGRHYAAGETFPHKGVPCANRKLRQIYDRRWIDTEAYFEQKMASVARVKLVNIIAAVPHGLEGEDE